MKITDEAISRVPILESHVLSGEHWETLRVEQRKLLKYIRGDKPGTEAVAYYTMDMERLTRYKGLPGAGDVFPTRFDIPHIAVHNHPDSRTFSLNDFKPFIDNPAMEVMSVVGHNGSVYALERLPDYEAANALFSFVEAVSNAPYPLADIDGHIAFVESFYVSLRKFGFVYRKG
jgi:hypothetical protein